MSPRTALTSTAVSPRTDHAGALVVARLLAWVGLSDGVPFCDSSRTLSDCPCTSSRPLLFPWGRVHAQGHKIPEEMRAL